MPKVSVCIPVYNVEKYIERCAKSLFEQTLDDIEYIFVDDCSPDRSIEILKDILETYPKRKPQTKILRMHKNSGLAEVRKLAVQHATGDYVIHCDSDDWVDINMYKILYEKASDENVDVVVCDYWVTDGCSYYRKVDSCHSQTPDQMIVNCLYIRDHWSLCNKLFKREAYIDITYPRGSMGEDMVMTFQLLWNSRSLLYIDKPYYYYNNNPESITKTFTRSSCVKRFEQLYLNAQIVLDFIESNELSDDAVRGIVVYKHFIRSTLYPVVLDKQYYRIWNETFKGLNSEVLRSSHLTLIEKFKVILTIFGLYPLKKNRAK